MATPGTLTRLFFDAIQAHGCDMASRDKATPTKTTKPKSTKKK